MQNLNAIPVSALRLIEAVARTGSLARAAEELGATPGALSQRLAKAEAALGQPLFLRHRTGLRPTPACARAAPRLTQAFAELSGTLTELRRQGSTVLNVTVAPIFASRWLIWHIGAFTARHPEISLRLLPATDIVDLDRTDIQVGIRHLSAPPPPGPQAIRLLDQRVFPVCSVALARNLRAPADLLSLPVIRENEQLFGWQAWLAPHGLDPARLKPGPTYADGSLCLDAAMLGQGVFMAWETLANAALQRGQIAAPFPDRVPTGAGYWFVTSRWAARDPAVRMFRDWLQAEMSAAFADPEKTAGHRPA
jgi:DNA-binding transcriptional LysR family regulator